MSEATQVHVTIKTDARPLIRDLMRAELACRPKLWRRLWLRFQIWRLRRV